MEKQDRRVKRTHQLLGDALIALAIEKGYDAVTIKDITERADVAYITFFRHYTDKDELLQKRLNEMLDELEEIAHQDGRASEGVQIFRYMQKHAPIYRILLSNQGTQNVFKKVKDRVAVHLYEHCEAIKRADGLVIPVEVVVNHIVVSLFGMIKWWLENEMPYPPEQMAKMYEALILEPVHRI